MAELSLDAYWRAPPIARTAATVTFGLSVAVHTGILAGDLFYYDIYHLLRIPPQIWRPVTCFLITFPNLGILFDTFHMYMYMSQLERGHPRLSRREDLVWYLTFISGTILILSHLSGFAFPFLTQALLLAMAYTVTQEQRGQTTNYMFISIPSQLVPFAMMAINLFFPGGISIVLMQLHGLAAAHLYLFLTKIWPEIGGGRNWLQTPAFITSLVNGATPAPQRPAGARIPGATSAQSSGASRGPLPDSWRTRGPGHRLG
ncbi:centromere microtubule-binding cbf5 [Trichoderma arundinaceum]|uniref:Derlin n=1 Tax=Trichoderma arundinaceum TaxID=490622 RepID=A0A395N9I8_TRIAR|nr:centromere microtubule-binding cbf5 [Trichoderma arundinaceum]